jgi:hypothetical protein
MKNGQSVLLERNAEWCRSLSLEEGDCVYTISLGVPVAIARLQQGFIRPIRVLNLNLME